MTLNSPDTPQLELGFRESVAGVERSTSFMSHFHSMKTTAVFETFWRFAVERQRIFFRRVAGEEPPWTEDPILARFKFTNAYRASDRASQFLIRNVIYRGSQEPAEIFFRTVLFKLFNRIETWRLFQTEFEEIGLDGFSVDRYSSVLSKAMDAGVPIYSAAYIMPPARGRGSGPKHIGHLKLLQDMIDNHAPQRVAEAGSLKEVFEILRSYPMMGDFLAYQYAIDLNYSVLLNFSEMEFVVPGPGARRGIRKCFSDTGAYSDQDVIMAVAEHQAREFEKRGLEFQDLWGRPLQLIDCQNLFCEVDKYARVAHPELNGRGGKRIKQRYGPRDGSLEYWYPPKWGLNSLI